MASPAQAVDFIAVSEYAELVVLREDVQSHGECSEIFVWNGPEGKYERIAFGKTAKLRRSYQLLRAAMELARLREGAHAR